MPMGAQIIPRTISISYFDPFEVFDNVKGELLDAVLFQNVHWKTHNGAIRTIEKLPVSVASEAKALDTDAEDVKLFMRFIVVNCISVDDYRAKVRPLIRKWLPVDEALTFKMNVLHSPMPIILLYSNSEVVASNLFKSVPIMDKFNKDFPNVNVLEIRSVYKSPQEKEIFWNQLSNQLKGFILDIFHQRLAYFQKQLLDLESESGNFEDELSLRENLLELYSVLNMHEEAIEMLSAIEQIVMRHTKGELPDGVLESPFRVLEVSGKKSGLIGTMLKENKLTKFQFHKYFFLRKFEFLLKDIPSTIKVLKLYKSLRDFLFEMEMLFKTSENWLKFKFNYLNEAISFLPGDNSVEIRAELLLSKRDCWIEGIQAATSYSLLNKTFPKTSVKYIFDESIDTFSSEELFHENYFRFTSEVLSLFNKCDGKRQRIVDILSIEIGILHYQRKEYDKAVSIFLSCHEYYMQSSWDLIGSNILKIFVDSLRKCAHIESLEIEEEAIPVSTILSNAFLNVLKVSDNASEKKKWWDEFLRVQKNQCASLMYSMDDLLGTAVLGIPYLMAPNVYALDLEVDNHGIPENITVDTIKLTLKNSDDAFVHFSAAAVVIDEGKRIYQLEATELTFGDFLPISVYFEIGSTVFTKQYLNSDLSTIHLYPLYDSASVFFGIQQARELNLGENALDICHYNLENTQTYELEVMVEDSFNSSNVSISFSKERDTRSVKIDRETIAQKLVYYMSEPKSSFSLRAKLSFTKNNCDKIYSEERSFQIECFLPISVSVEDIFKRQSFIFKFLLNSSTFEEPVILYSTKLLPPTGINHYEICGTYTAESLEYLTADPNEYCLNCYQITTSRAFNSLDTFFLRVSYNTMKEQLDQLVTDAVLVQGNLKWFSKFEVWKLFWDIVVLPEFRYDYQAFQKTRVIAINKGSLSSKNIRVLIEKVCIDKEVSARMLECFTELINGVQLSEIDINAYTANLARRTLIVPVQVPKLEQMFYVELLREDATLHEVGIPISLNIKVEKLGGKWGSTNVAGTYVFEMTSSNEWLVHGKKRMHISSDHTEFDIKIIPLKKGYLTYPRCQITNVDCDEPSRIDNPNLFETILVY